MDEAVTLGHDAGMSALPDPAQWAKWRWYITSGEQKVYLYLRWLATFPGGAAETTIRALARGIGDEEHRWKWNSDGPMSMAAFRRALEGLVRAGLVEVDWGTWD
jgi:hypothetical protein